MTALHPTLAEPLDAAIDRFVAWLDRFGETSYDHQSYFSGPIGRRAKALYYSHPKLGTLAVAPMILSEALLPSGRQLFWKKQRFPIADAHYAMGFAMLAKSRRSDAALAQATHFLDVLEQTRCAGYERHGWGYPFDWVTRNGVMRTQTPLITSTPYAYEAFAAVHAVDGNAHWLEVMASAAEHGFRDIHDLPLGPGVASCGYNPDDRDAKVVNASAYRAFMLTHASLRFGREDYRRAAEANLAYVLRAQQADGSWPYATDGVRPFVDHFHTCFVLKALAKIEKLTGHPGCRAAIDKGVGFYLANLFDREGMPRPFASAPRLTVYRNELYDYAECLNLAALLRGRDTALDRRADAVLADVLERWQKKDGSFRSRRLLLGWDDVPMHRWAQAQLFRSLCIWATGDAGPTPATSDAAQADDTTTAGASRGVAAIH